MKEKPQNETALPQTTEEILETSPEVNLIEAQEKWENQNTEIFIQEWIAQCPHLTVEQRVFVAKFLGSNHGPWEGYDDEDTYIHEFKVEGNKLILVFGRRDDSGQPYRVDEIIELPWSRPPT